MLKELNREISLDEKGGLVQGKEIKVPTRI